MKCVRFGWTVIFFVTCFSKAALYRICNRAVSRQAMHTSFRQRYRLKLEQKKQGKGVGRFAGVAGGLLGGSAISLALVLNNEDMVQAQPHLAQFSLLGLRSCFPGNQEQLDSWLLEAVQAQNVEVLELLLKRGANPNIRNLLLTLCSSFYLPEYAEKRAALIAVLLNNGADPNNPSYVLDHALFNGDKRICRMLVVAGAQLKDEQDVSLLERSLYVAARTGDVDVINKAIKNGVNIAAVQFKGKSLLSIAIEHGQLRVALNIIAGKEGSELSKTEWTNLYPAACNYLSKKP